MPIENLLADARKARLADDYETAIALCNAYLGASPDDPVAQSLLGLCEVETNRIEGAKRIEAAAARNPNNPVVALYLSQLRERQGDMRGAIKQANHAAALAGNHFEAWAQLGKLLGMAGKFDEALTALRHATRLRPGHLGILRLTAGAALETSQYAECDRALSSLEAAGRSPDTLRLRVSLERKRGRWTAMEDSASEWLEAEPASEEARIAVAFALAEQGYYDRAAAAYAPLCGGAWPRAQHLAALGRYYLGGRRLEDARESFNRAIARDAACGEATFGLARLNHFLGDSAEVEKWVRRTLAIEPSHADALALLAETSSGAPCEADLAMVEAAIASPSARPDKRPALLFAKGDLLHGLKRADAAFDAWEEANTLKIRAAEQAGEAYDPEAHEALVSTLMQLFPGEATPPESAGGEARAPIFIVGMPRSGTTLLEAAVAAHPDVAGAGEVPAMPFVLNDFITWAKASSWSGGPLPAERSAEWRALYLDQADRFGAGAAARFTDKQPSNILAVGLIARLFPAARIIWLRRNPVETGFSIFRRNFTRQWAFSTNLRTIAHYYAQHGRIGDHWLRAYPDRCAFVQYEDLVRNFEPTLKNVIDFCGLEWSDDCLAYHESGRAVMTFSAAQVRKPPSEKHIRSTGPYDHRLGALKAALADYGVDLETGARTGRDA
jgi:tetratricopeptide (TPR) repeat protein